MLAKFLIRPGVGRENSDGTKPSLTALRETAVLPWVSFTLETTHPFASGAYSLGVLEKWNG